MLAYNDQAQRPVGKLKNTKEYMSIFNKKSLSLICLLLLNSTCLFANEALGQTDNPIQKPAQTNLTTSSTATNNPIITSFIYNYSDFKFNSMTGNNFNRYQGHSNLYSVGADHFKLINNLFAGIYLFKVDTQVNSQILLAPGSLTLSNQRIKNATLFGHVLKILNPNFFIDLSGGYGQNKINSHLALLPTNSSISNGFYNNVSDNWFASLNGLYGKTWTRLTFKANAGVLLSEINTPGYMLGFQTNFPPQFVAPITSKSTFLIEGGELNYQIKPEIIPFINGSLIQVVQFSNSREVVSEPINGSLPQLNANENGYQLGAGVNLIIKKFVLHLEQRYYNSGGVFTSNQSVARIQYAFN